MANNRGAKKRRLRKLWEEAQGVCYLCGFEVPWKTKTKGLHPTLDHVIAKSKGATKLDNSKLAHQYCNLLKGSANPTEFLKDTIQINFRMKYKLHEENE